MSMLVPPFNGPTSGFYARTVRAVNRRGDQRWIAAKADRVRTTRVAHISSTFYGGGVAELLTPLTLMMNTTGIETDWH
jgi:hypothetical protein